MQFLLLLLLVLVGVPVPGTPRLPRAATPWSDRHKKKEEPTSAPPVPRDELDRARARATGSRVRRRLESDFDGDEDEEKENKAPDDLDELQDPISSLLQKWGEDIDWLKRKVSGDLDNFKKRLGIRP
uniref:E4 protein n=1 Tax=Human papillomavirus TaxID=10566 RepID=A0A2P1IUZ0_9PAPI|nr:E4 protein [Human papillomavirus]AYA94255.1 MAG: E4 protein [Human papillomavirus]